MFHPSLRTRLLAMPLAAASFGFVLAGSAAAADLPMRYKAPSFAPQVFNWTGFYLGGQVGYSVGRDRLLEYFTVDGSFTGIDTRFDLSGISGGLYLGSNYQIGNFVLGLEGDIEAANIKGNWNVPPGLGDTTINVQGSLRGRVGFLADRTLFYTTGGVAVGEVKHSYTNTLTGVLEPISSVRTGWTAGGGIEVALTPNLLARVEYRYTDYGMSRYDSVTSFPGLTGTQEPKLNTVRAGVAYKF